MDIAARIDRLRLRHLRLLELIDTHHSLRAVGQTLNLTQPAVSYLLKELEYAFGQPLVNRSARGVDLNPAGRLALERSRPGLATIGEIAEELADGAVPKIRIGTNPALLQRLVPQALRLVREAAPAMRFAIQSGTVGEMLTAIALGRVDCYVGRVDWDVVPVEQTALLRSQPLTDTELAIACAASDPLATRGRLSVRELADREWALPPHGSNNRTALESAFKTIGLAPPRVAVEVASDPQAMITLSLEMELLVCAPRLLLENPPFAGRMQVLDLSDLRLAPIHVGFVTLHGHETAVALDAMHAALVKAAAMHPSTVAV